VGVVVVPGVEVQAVALAAAVPEVVERAVPAAEPAAEAELPGVVVLRAGAAVLPAAGILDLIAILISTILTTNRG